MRRRTLLRGAVGALALPGLAGRAAASEHDSFEPLASVDIDGAKEAAVHHGGTVAYVATGDGFIKIKTPKNCTIIVFFEFYPLSKTVHTENTWWS